VPRRGAVIVPLIKGIAVAALLVGIMITGGILWALHDTPIAGEPARSDRPSLVLETADSRPLGRTGPLTDAATQSDFPDVLVNAVLSIEDRRFYRHVGIDPLGVLRAARVNLDAGEIVEGGSTITQQLVKLHLVGRQRTMERKLREIMLPMPQHGDSITVSSWRDAPCGSCPSSCRSQRGPGRRKPHGTRD
jgi:penicillin-binding protein 1A